jgi:hypothetical protein
MDIHLRVQHPLQGGFHHQPHQPIEVLSRPGLGGDLTGGCIESGTEVWNGGAKRVK